MYRIPRERLDVEAHFNDVGHRVRELMQSFLSGGYSFVAKYKDGHEVAIKVSANTKFPSLTRRWLQRCVNDERELKKLLCGDFEEQLKLVKEVLSDNPSHFKRTFNCNAPKDVKDGDGNVEMDDFHEIFRHILSERMFEGKYDEPHPMNKIAFVERLDLSLCPYCGDTYIKRCFRQTEGNKHVVAPKLDHFLPKSKYPFLALNCYNLIPACPTCNESPNKGVGDPLGEDKSHEYLMNPYQFRDSAFEFDYSLNGERYYENQNFNVHFNYKGNNDLPIGFRSIMATESHYVRCHPHTVGNLYRSFLNHANHARTHYKNVNLTEDFWDSSMECILNFPLHAPFDLEEEAYKLKKDLFEKLRCLDWTNKVKMQDHQ